MIDAEWLRAFVVFARHESFTHAARELHISQPALHAQIAKLTDQVGVALYRREGRALVLTKEGQRLLAFGREQEERTRRFLRELGRPGPAEPLVLAAGEGALRHLLADSVRSFVRSGGAPLRVLTRDAPGTLAAVSSGEAHLGVAVMDAVPDGLVAETLADVGVVVALPRAHRLARKRALRLHDLAGARLIVPPPGRPFRQTVETALASAGVPWEPAMEATGWDLALHFASLGLGLAVVHEFCAMPKGLVARRLRALPRVRYRALRRRRSLEPDEPLARLLALLPRTR